jgi:hypothetical protein
MESLALLGQFFGGLGFLCLGVGVLWFVTVYREIHQDKEE